MRKEKETEENNLKGYFYKFELKIQKLLKCPSDALQNSENFRVDFDVFKGSIVQLS